MRAPPLTDAAAAGTWRGETIASGLHGVDLAVGLAQMLLLVVPLGRPDTTGWRGPLVKARSCKVKGLDPVVKRYRVSRDEGPGGVAMPPEHRTGPSYMRMVLWHVRRGGTRLRGVATVTDGAAAGTWRGETDASGLHRVDLAVGFTRMLLPSVPLGRPDTTGWRGPLVKARLWKSKG